MARKVRGRYLIVVPLADGGSLTIETKKEKSLTVAEIVQDLRRQADRIELLVPRAPGQSNTK